MWDEMTLWASAWVHFPVGGIWWPAYFLNTSLVGIPFINGIPIPTNKPPSITLPHFLFPSDLPGVLVFHQDGVKLLEDLKLTGRMLGCHQVTAEVLGPEAVRFSSHVVVFWEKTRDVFIHGEFHWLVVWKYFLFSSRNLGKISNLTHIFQMGWNHQLVQVRDNGC